MQGTVKWFNETKGYGFIKPDKSDKDIFVHISALNLANIQTLDPNQRVEFDAGQGKKGLEATNLRLL